MRSLFGIDGCRGGWVVASSQADLDHVSIRVVSDLRATFRDARRDSLIAIDMPIGLSDKEPRACDTEARSLLGTPRRSSVFSPPCRRALTATTFPEALRLNKEVARVGISLQAFHIMPKIREVDALMTRSTQQYVREVHPEVAFAQLNARPMLHNKKTPAGRAERIVVLRKHGLQVPPQRLVGVPQDDVLDALVCLVTAFHIQAGRSKSLGRPDQTDAKGLLMEIVAPS